MIVGNGDAGIDAFEHTFVAVGDETTQMIVVVLLVMIICSLVNTQHAQTVANGNAWSHNEEMIRKTGVLHVDLLVDVIVEYQHRQDDTGTYVNIKDKSVISSVNGEKVVAPGTKGGEIDLSITGTPEVAVKVDYEVTTFSLDGWTVKNADGDEIEYCPIVFTIANKTYGMTGIKDSDGNDVDNAYNSVAALEAAIIETLKSTTADYAPNTDLSTSDSAANSITWEWAFEENVDDYDTQLGDKAAAGSAATIELDMTVTVTQVD